MPASQQRRFYNFKISNAADGGQVAEIVISDPIDDWWGASLKMLHMDLAGHTGPIDIKLNSPGGLITESLAMMNYLRGLSNTVTVTGIGLVASAATFLIEAADVAKLSRHSFFMIHRPTLGMTGNHDEMQSGANALSKIESEIEAIYLSAIKKRQKMIDGSEEKTIAQIRDWMKAETWFTATEALNYGFIDAILDDELLSTAATDEAIAPFESAIGNFHNAPARITNYFQIKKEMANVVQTPEAKPKTALPDWVQKLVNFFQNSDSGESAEKPLEEEGDEIEKAKAALEAAGDEIEKAKAALEAAGYTVSTPSDGGSEESHDEIPGESEATQAAIDAAVNKAIADERAKNARKTAGKPPVAGGEQKPKTAEDSRNDIRAKYAEKFKALADAIKTR